MTPRTQRRPNYSFLLLLVGCSIGLGGMSRIADAEARGPSRVAPRALNGQAAIDALGARLPEVAAAHDLTPARLRELFTQDRTLHLTGDLQLLYVETNFSGDGSPSLPDPSNHAGTLAAPESTFALHSRPSAAHTIYLDFDGHVTQNTRWNGQYDLLTIASPPFDTDGNPSSFSNAELIEIQQAWDGVAEDFRPFDVDVTTEDPGVEALRRTDGSDTAWGIRVVFTDDFTGGACQCGGMAYLGYFSANSDTPVFVFNKATVAEVIESASHEVGHSLKLHHDGTGTQEYYTGHGVGDGTSWAPIMGVGFQRLVTQWSQGGYSNASNLEDDLSIITTQNGFGFRADDHGNSSTNATPLTVSDAGNGRLAASGSGIIGGPSVDLDYFTFVSGPGPINLALRSDPPSTRSSAVDRPNLNVQVRLFDSNSTLLASSNGVQTVSLSLTVAGGRYSLAVTGAGVGSPLSSAPTGYTNYGSLGSYDISGTLPDAPCPVVESVEPMSAPAGSTITITGADLAWVRTLTFTGGIEAVFTLDGPTRIIAAIPTGAVSGPLTLTCDPYCPSVSTPPVTICQGATQVAMVGDGATELPYEGGCSGVTSVDDPGTDGSAFRIAPNPLVQECTIRFALPRAGISTVRIIDPAGRLVRPLQNGWTPAGPQQLRWDGRDRSGARVNPGVYFVAVDGAGGVRERGKLVILP